MILVTGGSGFIGGHLVEALCSRGERVRCLVRRKVASRAELVLGDLVSGVGIEAALEGVDLVIHLAGATKALKVEDYYSGNVRATEKLVRAVAARQGIRLVHVSSLAAMGPSLDGTPVREDDEARPLTHYGKSKLEGERIVRRLLPDAVIVRPPVVYGPRDTDVFQVLKPLSNGIAVQMGAGERWFSAIYVRDLVEGLIAASTTSGRTYFLANSTPVSWSDLRASAAGIMGRSARVLRVPTAVAYAAGFGAEMWARVTGKPGIISREKVTEALQLYWTCDTRRAAQEIGFEARTSLDAGLALTLAWYRENGWLKY